MIPDSVLIKFASEHESLSKEVRRALSIISPEGVEAILITWLKQLGWLPTIEQLAMEICNYDFSPVTESMKGGRRFKLHWAMKPAKRFYEEYIRKGLMSEPGKFTGQPRLTDEGFKYFRERGVEFDE